MREFSEVLGYSDTFVYAALLAPMERHGLVAVVERDGEQTDPRHPAARTPRSRQSASRVYYEVTEAGRERYRDWMSGAPEEGAAPRGAAHAADRRPTPSPTSRQLDGALKEIEEAMPSPACATDGRPLGSRSSQHAAIARSGVSARARRAVSHLQATDGVGAAPRGTLGTAERELAERPRAGIGRRT